MEFLFFGISMVICFGMGMFVTKRETNYIMDNLENAILNLDIYLENGFQTNWINYSEAEYLDRLERIYNLLQKD